MAAHYQSAAGPSRSFHPQPFPSSNIHSSAPHRTDRIDPSAAAMSSSSQWRSQSHDQVPSGGLGLGMIMPSSVSYNSQSPVSYSNPSPISPILPPKTQPLQTAPLRRDPSATDDGGSKRSTNPLTDLIDSEKVYVEQLTLVIRRVAAAWSRKDLPPQKLDAMFRCVEAVYRANRSFGVKLKEIAANPSDAKGLGDLLMRWVDELEPAYGRYVSIYLSGFDTYKPIVQNTILPGILDEVSESSPPTPPLQRWTLDALFLLPYARLRYYRKLYARLLKNTTEGRSDHRMLQTASQRLEALVGDIEARLECDVSEEANPSLSKTTSVGDQSREPRYNEKERTSRSSSALDSSVETVQSGLSSFNGPVDSTRSSSTSAATSVTQSPGRTSKGAANSTSQQAPPPPITDLEMRIDTERTIDLFNMQPRKCKLQMNPTNLPFPRRILSSHDATVFFTPSSTNQQVVHRRAHIFILSDLFLVTDWMEASDKAHKAQQVAREQPNRVGEGGPMPEMWLAYPPLAGKHLKIQEGQQTNVIAVTVMRKETFVIHAESEIERDIMLKNLTECIEFASGAPPPAIVTTMTSAPDPSASLSPISPINGQGSMRFPSSMSGRSSPLPESGAPSPSGLSSHMSQLTMASSNDSRWSQEQPPPGSARGMPMPSPTTPSGHPHSGPVRMPSGPGQYNMPGPGQHMAPGQPMASGQHMGGPPGHGGRPMAPGQGRPVTPGSGGSMPEQRTVSGPAGRSVSVHSAHSAHSAASAQSAPNFHHHGGMGMPAHRQGPPMHPNMPIPSRAAPAPPGGGQQYGQQYGMRSDLPPLPPPNFVNQRAMTNYSDSGGYPSHMEHAPPPRSRSAEPSLYDMNITDMRPPAMPSAHFKTFSAYSNSPGTGPEDDESPPGSPHQEEFTQLTGPTIISAQMKCKVFHQQGHGQWKSLGHGKLKLYVEKNRQNIKQLVVEHNNGKGMLISTIILGDGIERVGKTGVAVEISDRGHRTGIIYMIQLRNEAAAEGLHKDLLAGSDRYRLV